MASGGMDELLNIIGAALRQSEDSLTKIGGIRKAGLEYDF